MFLALDFFHWFIFWEISLVPAYFLIKLWGGPARRAAATQFFIYTFVGSVAMLLAMQAVFLATGTFDLPKLAEELTTLRAAMKAEAVEVEHDEAVAQIGKAQIEAKAGNGEKALAHLKSAGKWAFDTATKIGTSVAAEVIKKSMGL